MTMLEYAEKEWDLAFPPEQSDEMQNWIKENVMQLLKVFSDQGHTNMTGGYTLNAFARLARYKPIAPLTGEESEWQDCVMKGRFNDQQQNVRYSSVFRINHDNSTAYDIDGKVFIDEDGCAYTNRDSIVPVTFPYYVPDKPEMVKRKMEDPGDSHA
jgi:hypothetical protein